MNPKVLVVVPTYDERDNIASLIEALFGLGMDGLGVVVVDDRSPDGTADAARALRPRYPRLTVVERGGPRGRGHAGREGFLFALDSGAEAVVEMDADFSHQPRHVPQLLAALAGCDVAIGSRRAPGGSDDDRPLARRALTVLANAYARRLLRLPVLDTNSGFRAYRREALQRIDPASLRSAGPSIVHEVLYRAVRAKLRVAEIPIEFIDRKAGASKLNLARLAVGYFWIARLALSALRAGVSPARPESSQ